MVAGVRPETSSAWMTAVSVSASVPRTSASAVVPSLNETLSVPPSPATSTTWLLVRIWPSSVRMMPEPEPLPWAPVTLICTTEGSTLSATASTLPSERRRRRRVRGAAGLDVVVPAPVARRRLVAVAARRTPRRRRGPRTAADHQRRRPRRRRAANRSAGLPGAAGRGRRGREERPGAGGGAARRTARAVPEVRRAAARCGMVGGVVGHCSRCMTQPQCCDLPEIALGVAEEFADVRRRRRSPLPGACGLRHDGRP